MFLALREIRFATGRFTLMGSAVALISLLLVMLSGLTAGLAQQNTSALASLDADAVIFNSSESGSPSFTESQVTAQQLQIWRNTDGISETNALGITQTRAETTDDATAASSVAVFGAESSSPILPENQLSTGQVIISQELAEDLGISEGEQLQLASQQLEVTAIAETQWYSHTPVVWTTAEDWAEIAHLNDEEAVGTVLTASFSDPADAQQVAVTADAAAATESMSPEESFSALSSFSSENGALTLIQALLYGISALVIIAFITVWTVQRTRDIAVLKALGAAQRYVFKDALGQALIVLCCGAALGGLLGVVGGLLASGNAPFQMSVATTLLPVFGVVILGLCGAALAVRGTLRVDPLLALGGS